MRPFSYLLPKDYITKITPRDFEILVRDFLVETGKDLKDLDVQHDVKEIAHDGVYPTHAIAQRLTQWEND